MTSTSKYSVPFKPQGPGLRHAETDLGTYTAVREKEGHWSLTVDDEKRETTFASFKDARLDADLTYRAREAAVVQAEVPEDQVFSDEEDAESQAEEEGELAEDEEE